MTMQAWGPKFQGLALYISPDRPDVSATVFSSKGSGIGRNEVKVTVHDFSGDLFEPHSKTYRVAESPLVGDVSDMLDDPDTDVNAPAFRKQLADAVDTAMLFQLQRRELLSQGNFKKMNAVRAADFVAQNQQGLVQRLLTAPLTHEVKATLRGPQGETLIGTFVNGELIRAARESRFYERKKTFPVIYVDSSKDSRIRPNAAQRNPLQQWWRHWNSLMPTILEMPEEMKRWERVEQRSATLQPAREKAD